MRVPLSAKEARTLLTKAKRGNKYKAVKVTVDGHVFDSKTEATRFQHLRLLERAGEIRALVAHPKYPLVVEGEHICSYEGDSSYFDVKLGKHVVEDVKSKPTKTDAYKIKRKLFMALFPEIEHREFMK